MQSAQAYHWLLRTEQHRMAWYLKRLRAIGYPDRGDSFDISNINHIQTLIAWLEDTKIRSYKIDERLPLRTMNDQWDKAFREYLTQLRCPHKLNDVMTIADWTLVVDWILAHAIGLVYRDNAESFNQHAQKQLEAKQHFKTPKDISDYTSAQFKAALTTLTSLLHIPMDDDHVVLLNTIQKAIRGKFSKTALDMQNISLEPNTTTSTSTTTSTISASKTTSLHMDTSITEDKFPLGFNTGEKQVDMASTVMRLLFIKDLRELQTEINDLIVTVQSFTANPKTNTTLGKVGH